MAGDRLPARLLLRSQLWFRWTGKCFEAATSHMQTVVLQVSTLVKQMKKASEFLDFFSIFKDGLTR
jgi:hypothetical protein